MALSLGKACRLPKAADPTMKVLTDVSLESSGLNTAKMCFSNQTSFSALVLCKPNDVLVVHKTNRMEHFRK